MMKGFLRIILYIAFGFLSFFIFLYILFPYGAIKGRIETGVEGSFGSEYNVKIGNIRLIPITGVVAKDIVISHEEADGIKEVAKIEKVKGRLSILPLLWGVQDVSFSINNKKSRLSGKYKGGRNSFKVSLDIEEVNLADFGFLAVKYGLNIESNINGEAHIDFYPFEPLRNDGEVLLNISNLQILASNIKFGSQEGGVIEIPPINAASAEGNSKIKIVVERGRVMVEEFQFSGQDMSANITGNIYFSQNVSNYRLGLLGSIKFKEEVESKIPLLLIVDKQKNEEGAYPFSVRGRFKNPSIRVGTFNIPL